MALSEMRLITTDGTGRRERLLANDEEYVRALGEHIGVTALTISRSGSCVAKTGELHKLSR